MKIMYLANKHFLLGLLMLGVTLGGLGTARADVTQPNGTVIPLTTSLQDYLNGSAQNDNINEGINGVTDAATEPQVFSPLCDFSGKYVAKGGGANFAIGWYNVDANRASANPPKYVPVDTGAGLNTAAANSDIQILFPFSSALPANRDLQAASIRMSPAYKKGLIGFALIPNPNGTGNANATQYHYTEHRFNVQCTQCATKGPWYSTLTYKSKKLDNTFYLGFEDLDFKDAAGTAGVNGNDLDYEDFLFRFTGISCLGAGEACTIDTNKGACALGVKECDGTGKLTCKAIVQPGQNVEKCDGVDNNCDGQVDENAPCPTGQICDRGRCTVNCGGEIPCARGLACDSGRCIDAECVGVTCPAGQVCRNGTCGGACTGIKCPSPTICSDGLCVDPCVGVTCATGKTCINGACVTTCDCLPCGSALACQTSTGKCVDSGCENMTCGVGEACQAGACVSACTGAVCPAGQACTAGKCQDDTSTGTNTEPDLGDGNLGGGAISTSSCACRLTPDSRSSSILGLGTSLLLLGLALLRSRRRA